MDASTDQKPTPPVGQMRWLGFLMFLGGGAIGYLAVVLPLLSASRHEDETFSISPKCVILAPALLVFGPILFFMGNERAGRMFGSRERPSALGWVICGVTACIGILLYEWLKGRLRAYGYAIDE